MDTGLSFFGRKGLPQGRALPLLTSPCSAQFQVPGLPGGWIKGKETRSHEENRCPREVGGGSQLSNSYSPNVNRACPAPSCWAWFQEQNAATYTLSSASILQMEDWEPMGTGSSGTRM